VLVAVQTSKFLSISFQPTEQVFSHMTIVFALDDYHSAAVLNATWHTDWIIKCCSTLETRLRYIPTDGFETFPFPDPNVDLHTIGEKVLRFRRDIMLTRDEGLTTTYNRFHAPEEKSADICELRRLQVDMDHCIASAYSWDVQAISLDHGFYETKQGMRYCLSELSRNSLLDRLLHLNHERHATEVAAGKQEKVTKPTKIREKGSAHVPTLF
jgi:hypothetical protein